MPTRLALRKRRGDGAQASLGMVSTSSKPRPDSRITAATSVAEAQLLLEQAIVSTREATAAATQAAAAARAAQLAAEEAAGTATTALATLAAVSGKDPGRIEVDAWISPPARVARPRSATPVVDNAAIVAACDVAAGSSTSHRAHVAESSGLGLAMGAGLAAPVAEEGLAGAAASDAACAPTAAEEQALAALSDAWEGARPAYIPVPLPPDVETVQLANIAKARALVKSVRQGFAGMREGDIVSVELQPHADSRTTIGLDIGFVETYTAAIHMRLQEG